jgi:hypothetical protein
MLLKLDENLGHHVAGLLANAGHEVATLALGKRYLRQAVGH